VSTLVRLQFKTTPDPKTLGTIIAYATMDDGFEDADILEDQE
jgi:hypothetical protein